MKSKIINKSFPLHPNLGLVVLLLLLVVGVAGFSRSSNILVTHAQTANSPTGRNPKIAWTPQQQAVWERMKNENHPWWQAMKHWADCSCNGSASTSSKGMYDALVYQTTGDQTYAQKAWNIIQPEITVRPTDANQIREDFIDLVLMYDWLKPALTPAQQTAYLYGADGDPNAGWDGIDGWADYSLRINVPANASPFNGGFRLGDTDQNIGQYFGLALVDVATGPENSRAGSYLNQSTHGGVGGNYPVGGLDATASDRTTVRNAIKNYVDLSAGGMWVVNSSEYSHGDQRLLYEGAYGLFTATGVDHFPEVTALRKEAVKEFINRFTPDLHQHMQHGDEQHFRDLWIPPMDSAFGVPMGLEQSNPQIGPYATSFLNDFMNQGSPTDPAHFAGAQNAYPYFFLFMSPYAPSSDWRTAPFVTAFYASGVGHIFFHDGHGVNDSFFGAEIGNLNTVDHGVKYHGNFQLWRHGEWAITHDLCYCTQEGELANSMLMAGLSSTEVQKQTVAQEFGPNNSYAYIAGNTQGQYYAQPYFQPPPTFLNEWTRSLFYLPSSNKKSDTVIVYDRTNVNDPKTLNGALTRYRQADQDRINAASHLKQWFIHSPVAPTTSNNAISWKTAGGQNIQVSTLLPANQTKAVIDEHSATAPDMSSQAVTSEKKFRTIIGDDTTGWSTFLNVVQASDTGFNPDNTTLKSASGDAEGVLIKRVGLNDTVVMFSANQTNRILGAGYTVTITPGSAAADAYFTDLDPSKSWTLTINGTNAPISVSANGVGRASLSGTSAQTVVLKGSGTNGVAPTPTPASPVLTLVKTVDKTTANPGDTLTYMVTVKNTGNVNATNVVMSDPIPIGTTYVVGSADKGGTIAANKLTWNVGALAAGATYSVAFKATINSVATPPPVTDSPPASTPPPTGTSNCTTGKVNRVAHLDLKAGENTAYAGAIDGASGIGLFSPEHPNALATLVNLNGCGQAPTEVGSVALPAASATSVVLIDTKNHMGYIGSVNGTLYKLDLHDTTKAPVIIGNSTVGSSIFSGAIDEIAGTAYFGSIDGHVYKVDLGQGNTLPKITGTITLKTGETGLHRAVLPDDKGYVYFATFNSPGKIVKIKTNPLQEIGSLTLNSGEDQPNNLAADHVGHLFTIVSNAGSSTAQLVEIAQGVGDAIPTRLGAISVPEKTFTTAVTNPNANEMYFSNDLTFPSSNVVKVTSDASGKFQIAQDIKLTAGAGQAACAPPGAEPLCGDIYVQSIGGDFVHGNLYLGTDTYPSRIIKIQL